MCPACLQEDTVSVHHFMPHLPVDCTCGSFFIFIYHIIISRYLRHTASTPDHTTHSQTVYQPLITPALAFLYKPFGSLASTTSSSASIKTSMNGSSDAMS